MPEITLTPVTRAYYNAPPMSQPRTPRASLHHPAPPASMINAIALLVQLEREQLDERAHLAETEIILSHANAGTLTPAMLARALVLARETGYRVGYNHRAQSIIRAIDHELDERREAETARIIDIGERV